MQNNQFQVHIGLRTVKTAVAVIIAMLIVDNHGVSSSRLVFAMLGVMAAVQPTFRESLDACFGQIISVVIGSVFGVLLLHLPISHFLACGIGVLIVITVFNSMRLRYIPNIACLVLVLICTSPDIVPRIYALERMWDTAIGLAVGFVFNTLVLPYNNSKKIVKLIEGLERELIWFLEHLFDNDDVIPEAEVMMQKIDYMAQQLSIFSKQKLVLHLRRQKKELETYRICERKARELLARMEVLSQMNRPGRLTEENRHRLAAAGAEIRDTRVLDCVQERDVVTNYHVAQILSIRHELMEALRQSSKNKKR